MCDYPRSEADEDSHTIPWLSFRNRNSPPTIQNTARVLTLADETFGHRSPIKTMIYNKLPKKFQPRFEVVSCYIEHNNKILLLHRHKNKSEGDKWGVPAGKIDSGESEMEAVIREIREETGQKFLSSELKYLTKVYVKYPEYHFIYHMFHIKIDKQPKVRLSTEEHKTYKWLLPNEVLKLNLVRELDRCIKMFY